MPSLRGTKPPKNRPPATIRDFGRLAAANFAPEQYPSSIPSSRHTEPLKHPSHGRFVFDPIAQRHHASQASIARSVRLGRFVFDPITHPSVGFPSIPSSSGTRPPKHQSSGRSPLRSHHPAAPSLPNINLPIPFPEPSSPKRYVLLSPEPSQSLLPFPSTIPPDTIPLFQDFPIPPITLSREAIAAPPSIRWTWSN